MLASLVFFMSGTGPRGGLALVLATASALLSGAKFRDRAPRHTHS